MIRMSVGQEDQRNFMRRSADFFQIILEKEAGRENTGIDEADLVTYQEV
jgi:hypothetical protein